MTHTDQDRPITTDMLERGADALCDSYPVGWAGDKGITRPEALQVAKDVLEAALCPVQNDTTQQTS